MRPTDRPGTKASDAFLRRVPSLVSISVGYLMYLQNIFRPSSILPYYSCLYCADTRRERRARRRAAHSLRLGCRERESWGRPGCDQPSPPPPLRGSSLLRVRLLQGLGQLLRVPSPALASPLRRASSPGTPLLLPNLRWLCWGLVLSLSPGPGLGWRARLVGLRSDVRIAACLLSTPFDALPFSAAIIPLLILP